MGDFFLGEIRIFSFSSSNFLPPRGWALCNGQMLAVNQNQALFALLGNTFGGQYPSNFALPNLEGRMPVGFGSNPKVPGFVPILGRNGGEAEHTLTTPEIPAHSHHAVGSASAPDSESPEGNYWATQSGNAYAATANATLNQSAIGAAGGSQPHPNTHPYQVLAYCIAIQGVFPPRQ